MVEGLGHLMEEIREEVDGKQRILTWHFGFHPIWTRSGLLVSNRRKSPYFSRGELGSTI